MDNTYKLSEILSSVKQLIQDCYYDGVWIEAELSDWKVNKFSGHSYGELVEHDDKGKKKAACRFTCWKYKVFEINAAFKRVTDESIKAGIKVKVLVKLSFSEIYGFSANILDIDPKFTLGDIQANIQDILKALSDKKIDQKNQLLEEPFDYFNVSIISSPTAAGLEDFKQIADYLERDGLCKFNYIDALMQGDKSVPSIISALNEVDILHKNEKQDCAIILRGGGSVLDLATFNDYNLAETICNFSLPIYCAIGHERDQCIIDMIANQSFGTPSKAIQFIENTILSNAKEIIQYFNNIQKSVFHALDSATAQLNHLAERTVKLAEFQLEKATQVLVDEKRSINVNSNNLLSRSKVSVENLYKLILANGVEQTLSKGYCVVKNEGGVVLSKASAQKDGVKSLVFQDGEYQLWQN
jgi:exodeoxyribonuclease VII large subunit